MSLRRPAHMSLVMDAPRVESHHDSEAGTSALTRWPQRDRRSPGVHLGTMVYDAVHMRLVGQDSRWHKREVRMPLAGNLRQFALSDVLRLVESGQRTGRLYLRRGDRTAAIYFAGGQWLLAERIGSAQVLAHNLARAGFISPEQFEMAVGVPFDRAGEVPDVQVVRSLIANQLLSQEQMRHVAVSDAVNLLTVVMQWPDGDFVFEEGVSLPPGRVWLPLPVGLLVAEAARRGRGAGSPRDLVPLAPEAVLDFAEIDPDSGTAIQLTRDQWRLLTAIDGKAPLWEIVRRLQAPQSTILRLAAELVASGVAVEVGRSAPVST